MFRVAAALAAACMACGDDATHVRRSPGEAEPEPPPPAWCDGGGTESSESPMTAIPPPVLEPVPRTERATVCPPETALATRPLDGGDFGTEYWCERDGQRHGRWSSFWSDGSLQAQREYRAGQPHGFWRIWYPHGDPWLERRYQDGARHGAQREYYEDHQLRLELHYTEGQPDGVWRYWNRRGDVVCARSMGPEAAR